MRNSSSLDWLRFMHTPNDYRVSPFLLAQSCHLTGTTVSIWWHWSANTMAQGKALSTDYLFSSSLGATT